MNFIATSELLITLGCRGKGRQPQKGTGPFSEEPARKAWYRLKYLRRGEPVRNTLEGLRMHVKNGMIRLVYLGCAGFGAFRVDPWRRLGSRGRRCHDDSTRVTDRMPEVQRRGSNIECGRNRGSRHIGSRPRLLPTWGRLRPWFVDLPQLVNLRCSANGEVPVAHWSDHLPLPHH